MFPIPWSANNELGVVVGLERGARGVILGGWYAAEGRRVVDVPQLASDGQSSRAVDVSDPRPDFPDGPDAPLG